MKHLKTFENYSIKELFDFSNQINKKSNFYKTLSNSSLTFNKKNLLKQAKDDDFRGNLQNKGSELIYVPSKGSDVVCAGLPAATSSVSNYM